MEDMVSYREMGDDDLLDESLRHMSHFNGESKREGGIIVQQTVFSNESGSPSPNSSSSSLQTNFGGAETSFKPYWSFPTSYVLSFDNCVAEPVSTSTRRSHYYRNIQPMVQPQTKTRRAHILAERKRREELTKLIVALSATIPGLKKADKASVLREATNYVKQLEERVKELENQKKNECVDHSTILMKKTLLCMNDGATLGCVEELPKVKVTVLEKEMLIEIHCEKQRQSMLKIILLLNNLHLSITSSSVLPFGTSTLKITIIAQMDDKYNMAVDDLAHTLRQLLLSLKSQDVQK
ncbi:transcription factor bHLH25 [Cajanus cajan]|uniref:transcription factor bHLH25 n=1 Tax=Cajanus cajan TaxID=3821 RepID=UPI0010FB18F8|nr:transcription factor bHLH25 [Cajanus cajan]